MDNDTMKKNFLKFKKKAIKEGRKIFDKAKEVSGDFVDDVKVKLRIKELKDMITDEKINIGKNIWYKKVDFNNADIIQAKENIALLKESLEIKIKNRSTM